MAVTGKWGAVVAGVCISDLQGAQAGRTTERGCWEDGAEITTRKPGWRTTRASAKVLVELTLSRSVRQDAGDLREDLVDLGRNVGHNGAGGDGHEARHQRVFDQVLPVLLLPDLQLKKHIF